MAKNAIAVVAVATDLVGAVVEPVDGPDPEVHEKLPAGDRWPAEFLAPNLTGEVVAEVRAVYVGDVDRGGRVVLLIQSLTTQTGLAEVAATSCKVRRRS